MDTTNNNTVMLYNSIKNGNLEQVEKILETPIDVNNEIYGKTPLMLACEHNQLDIVRRLLIVPGIHVNYTNMNDKNALLISLNNLEIVKELLKVPEIDVRYGKPLFRAYTIIKNRDVTKELLKHKRINVNEYDYNKNTVLVTAINRKDSELVSILLNKPNIDVRLQNPLSVACIRYGNIEIINLLLSHPNINVNIAPFPLLIAYEHNDMEVTERLLNFPGIDVNVYDREGQETILMMAISRNDLQTVQSIIQIPNMNINKQNGDGMTALMKAASLNRFDCVNILLHVPGILVNIGDSRGRTALILTRNNEIREALQAAGATNTPQQAPQIPQPIAQDIGIAFEIHEKFKHVQIDDFIKYMKELLGNKDANIPTSNKDFTLFVKISMLSFIHENNRILNVKLNEIYTRRLMYFDYPTREQKLFFYILEYVKSKNTKFQQNYIEAFLTDCTEAYNAGNRLSCSKGIKERIVISLETAIASMTEMTYEYKKVLHLIDPTKYSLNMNSRNMDYTMLFNQFGSVCQEFTTRNAFIDCIKTKVREELRDRFNEQQVMRALEEYVQHLDLNNDPVLGGKRRTYRKRKGYKTRKMRIRKYRNKKNILIRIE